MPSQARTVITAIKFATVAPDSKTCRSDIRAGVLNLTYTIAGQPQVQINTQPGGPVPPPPNPEPPSLPDSDPVNLLLLNGWKITEWVVRGQPAGFGIGAPYNGGVSRPGDPTIKNPEFEKLDLSFTFPMYCICAESGKCIAANFRFKVEYDGATHPKITLEMSDEGNCADVAARPINKEVGPPQSTLNGNRATYTFDTGVTCDCGEPDESKGRCPLSVICEYEFRTAL